MSYKKDLKKVKVISEEHESVTKSQCSYDLLRFYELNVSIDT